MSESVHQEQKRSFGNARVDLMAATSELEGKIHRLTALEVQALAYFDARRGQVVGRQELEREVWGYRAGVRSQAVPVAIRRLRSKVGADALQTVHGRGWRVGERSEEPVTPVAPVAVPRFPIFGRQAELEDLAARCETGRPVLVAGPAGVGKTRLAAAFSSRWSGRPIQVSVEGVVSLDGLWSSLADALQVPDARPDRIRHVLEHRESPLLFLDGVEGLALDGLFDALVSIPGQVVATSRRWEAGHGWEVLHLQPFDIDEGRAFLMQRLRQVQADPSREGERLDTLVRAVDGLPAALELYAAKGVLGLQPVLAMLDRDGLSEDLVHTIARSWDPLSESERDALLICAAFRGPIPLDAAVELCDPSSLGVLRSRSLLEQGDNGLHLLEVVRAFCRGQSGFVTARLIAHQWILGRATRWADTAQLDPRRCTEELRRLRQSLLEIVDVGAPAHVAQAARAIAEGVRFSGPDALARRVLTTAMAKNTDPVVLEELRALRAWSDRSEGASPEVQLSELSDLSHPEARLFTGHALTTLGRLDEARAVYLQLADDHPDHWAASVGLIRMGGLQYNALVTEAETRAYMQRASEIADRGGFIWCQVYITMRSASIVARFDGMRAARPVFRRALALTQEHQFPREEMEIWNLLGMAELVRDVDSSHAAFLSAIELANQCGINPSRRAFVLNAGITANLLDRPDYALDNLVLSEVDAMPILYGMTAAILGMAYFAKGEDQKARSSFMLSDASEIGMGLGQSAEYGHHVVALMKAERLLVAGDPAIEELLTRAEVLLPDDRNGLLTVLCERIRRKTRRS